MPGCYTVFNGICWSPDGRVLYTADSWSHRIYAHDFDGADGSIANRRVFAELPPHAGVPDGATVDTDGYLWVAVFDGWRVMRFAPDGSVDRQIPLPVQRPTSCIFGGPELATLYVTTARSRLSEAELEAQPLAGSILAIEPGGKGLPSVRFGA